MADMSGLTIAADEPIASLSEALEREPGAPPERRVELLAEAARAQGVGGRATRGLPDVWRKVADALAGRRPAQVLGPFEVSARWLCFHVPPGGKGQLKLANKVGSEWGLSIKAIGTGWGSGRAVTLSVNRDFQERTRCLSVALALRTRVTTYEGESPPRADVLGVAGLAVEELARCPDCSGDDERRGAANVTPAGEWIDLRRDPLGQTMETSVELVDETGVNLSVPFRLPGSNVQIGVDWSRRSQLGCTTRYVFPGGRRYRPSSSDGEPSDLPYWRCD